MRENAQRLEQELARIQTSMIELKQQNQAIMSAFQDEMKRNQANVTALLHEMKQHRAEIHKDNSVSTEKESVATEKLHSWID